ncbi:MAG: hypothetical protein K6B52_09485 [Clostridiales bacterium]|nr:hypothetical protein [Clostridiales bacterium]
MKKVLSVLLCAVMMCSLFSCFTAYAASDYTIVSPYDDVVWSGDNAWGAYRGVLHSHTTWSDANEDLPTMVKEYYSLGYDFLANSDHAVTGVEWNKKPKLVTPYWYQYFLGKKLSVLSDEEYEAITSGTYNGRGYGMTCITGANELNHLTLSKNHVNGYFLPANVGNGFAGYYTGKDILNPSGYVGENEAGIENALRFVENNGALSHINHPGDVLDSNRHPEVVTDPETVSFYGNLILKYKSCLGIEALNEVNTVTRYDRVLWDQLLMHCLPYGKTVIGFSNTDAHSLLNCDSSFSVFMMKENTQEEVKKTMQSGAFFCVSKCLPGNDVYEIGPKEDIDVRGKGIPYPMFGSVEVSGHKVTVTAENASEIQWIADGKVIMKSAVGADPIVLDLDTIEGSRDFSYIRAEILGEGGICLTQALVIDDGSQPLTFHAEDYTPTFAEKIMMFLRGTKIFNIIVEIYRAFR